MSRIGVLNYEQSEYFKLAIRDIFRVRNEFFLVFCSVAYSFPQKMSVKCPFITNLVPRKVENEMHIRKVAKSKERKVKNI